MKEITQEYLESIVPERIFWRGEDLYDEGAVQNVDVSEKQISAKVLGTRLYSVEAEIREDNFMFSCSCPYEGFCKHSIALGLWMVEHKRILSKMKALQESDQRAPEITSLLEKATPGQKDVFLKEALNESPMLLNRFEVMIKGAVNLGKDIDIDRLVDEIKAKMEAFDLENYDRFYEREPKIHGYREEWEILRDGVESEFAEIFDEYKNRALELLKIRNVIGSFKCLLAVYEAVQIADFESIEDPAYIYEEEGLGDLAEINLEQFIGEYISGFSTLSFEENVHMQLIDIFFNRFAKGIKNHIYRISDFTEILISCIKTKNIAVHLSKLLQKNSGLAEEDYSEISLAVNEKLADKEKWLEVAENNYKINRTVAEKLLQHFVSDKKKLMQFAQDIAFRFNNEFIPFFYENLNKEDNPDLYRKILSEHARISQTIALYRKLKKEYGADAAWEFIDSLENDWNAERFYILLLQEEKAYEKLLSLAKKKSDRHPAMAYLRPLVNRYPDDVFKIISTHAGRFLDENTGRNYYRQAAEWLKLLKQIRDKKTGKEATEFIKHLLDKFSNRRAMKDEFSKAGLC
jgi:hypothetical protein